MFVKTTPAGDWAIASVRSFPTDVEFNQLGVALASCPEPGQDYYRWVHNLPQDLKPEPAYRIWEGPLDSYNPLRRGWSFPVGSDGRDVGHQIAALLESKGIPKLDQFLDRDALLAHVRQDFPDKSKTGLFLGTSTSELILVADDLEEQELAPLCARLGIDESWPVVAWAKSRIARRKAAVAEGRRS